MALTNTQKIQLNAAAITMFDVPMGGYADWLETSLEGNGGNLLPVLTTLAATPYFMSQYAGTQDSVATKMAAAYGFLSVTGGLGQQVKQYFLSNLQGGVSIPSLFNQANDFLTSTSDPLYADAKALLVNKINVANFYTYGVRGDSQDLATLQQVISTVGVSASTVISAKIQLASHAGAAGPANSAVTLLTSDNDVFTGSDGDDNIDALGGNDSVAGAAGNDRLVGGIGNDTLDGGLGQDILVGGSGNDTLIAGTYSTSTLGWDGLRYAYTYTFDAFSEVLLGGDGADTLRGGNGSDVLDGGTGADIIYGDYNSYDALNATEEQLKGMFNDTIFGGEGADTIFGGYGVDYIDAGTGDDRATLGSGGGYLDGGEGNDTLYGSTGNDTIYGGPGDDAIQDSYATGDDFADGGAGNDTIRYQYHKVGSLTLVGGDGNDTIDLEGGTSYASISAGEGIDRVILGNGTYSVDLTESVSSTDRIDVNNILFGGNNPTTITTVTGFNPAADVIDVGNFSLWGKATGSSSTGANLSSNGTVKNTSFVQTVDAPSTPLQDPSGGSTSTYVNGKTIYNTDYYGKGILIVTGASAASADTATVANFMNPYGNNAIYSVNERHYFVVDIAGRGAALYQFKDDSNGDNNIVADELTPMVLLTGVSAATLNDFNFV